MGMAVDFFGTKTNGVPLKDGSPPFSILRWAGIGSQSRGQGEVVPLLCLFGSSQGGYPKMMIHEFRDKNLS